MRKVSLRRLEALWKASTYCLRFFVKLLSVWWRCLVSKVRFVGFARRDEIIKRKRKRQRKSSGIASSVLWKLLHRGRALRIFRVNIRNFKYRHAQSMLRKSGEILFRWAVKFYLADHVDFFRPLISFVCPKDTLTYWKPSIHRKRKPSLGWGRKPFDPLMSCHLSLPPKRLQKPKKFLPM